MLADAVTLAQCDRTNNIKIDGNIILKFKIISIYLKDLICYFIDKTVLDVPASEQWFEQWRETFLSVQFPVDHEFTRHFLSCLIVLSSSDPNPLDCANQLTKKVQMMQNVTPPKLPKWFSTDILNCYVMLHDGCNGDITK